MSTAMDRAPSGYRVEHAMSVAMSLASRLTAEDPETDLAALIDAIANQTEVMVLLRRIVLAHLEADGFSDACDERIKALTARRDRFRRLAADTKAAAFAMLDALGIPKLKEPEFTASISAGRTAIIIADEAALPDEYVEIRRIPKKADIARAVKDGEVIPGAEQSNSLPSLTIRRN